MAGDQTTFQTRHGEFTFGWNDDGLLRAHGSRPRQTTPVMTPRPVPPGTSLVFPAGAVPKLHKMAVSNAIPISTFKTLHYSAIERAADDHPQGPYALAIDWLSRFCEGDDSEHFARCMLVYWTSSWFWDREIWTENYDTATEFIQDNQHLCAYVYNTLEHFCSCMIPWGETRGLYTVHAARNIKAANRFFAEFKRIVGDQWTHQLHFFPNPWETIHCRKLCQTLSRLPELGADMTAESLKMLFQYAINSPRQEDVQDWKSASVSSLDAARQNRWISGNHQDRLLGWSAMSAEEKQEWLDAHQESQDESQKDDSQEDESQEIDPQEDESQENEPREDEPQESEPQEDVDQVIDDPQDQQQMGDFDAQDRPDGDIPRGSDQSRVPGEKSWADSGEGDDNPALLASRHAARRSTLNIPPSNSLHRSHIDYRQVLIEAERRAAEELRWSLVQALSKNLDLQKERDDHNRAIQQLEEDLRVLRAEKNKVVEDLELDKARQATLIADKHGQIVQLEHQRDEANISRRDLLASFKREQEKAANAAAAHHAERVVKDSLQQQVVELNHIVQEQRKTIAELETDKIRQAVFLSDQKAALEKQGALQKSLEEEKLKLCKLLEEQQQAGETLTRERDQHAIALAKAEATLQGERVLESTYKRQIQELEKINETQRHATDEQVTLLAAKEKAFADERVSKESLQAQVVQLCRVSEKQVKTIDTLTIEKNRQGALHAESEKALQGERTLTKSLQEQVAEFVKASKEQQVTMHTLTGEKNRQAAVLKEMETALQDERTMKKALQEQIAGLAESDKEQQQVLSTLTAEKNRRAALLAEKEKALEDERVSKQSLRTRVAEFVKADKERKRTLNALTTETTRQAALLVDKENRINNLERERAQLSQKRQSLATALHEQRQLSKTYHDRLLLLCARYPIPENSQSSPGCYSVLSCAVTPDPRSLVTDFQHEERSGLGILRVLPATDPTEYFVKLDSKGGWQVRFNGGKGTQITVDQASCSHSRLSESCPDLCHMQEFVTVELAQSVQSGLDLIAVEMISFEGNELPPETVVGGVTLYAPIDTAYKLEEQVRSTFSARLEHLASHPRPLFAFPDDIWTLAANVDSIPQADIRRIRELEEGFKTIKSIPSILGSGPRHQKVISHHYPVLLRVHHGLIFVVVDQMGQGAGQQGGQWGFPSDVFYMKPRQSLEIFSLSPVVLGIEINFRLADIHTLFEIPIDHNQATVLLAQLVSILARNGKLASLGSDWTPQNAKDKLIMLFEYLLGQAPVEHREGLEAELGRLRV
ncbi:hypothetical protein NliqN6_6242 [Naganishia liquefaciens]|uniref:Uncharacterized protein n=1 Tax=Naganishia liquefaciens TaxID=104408 RepID=A0A8H3TZ24_9TREE|nr:hypothetical protein NliqN6_6242 [Naganishia liquefaciens]